LLWGEDEEGAEEEDDGGHAEDKTVEEDGEVFHGEAVRGQWSEVRGQRSEVRGQRSEVRGQRSGFGRSGDREEESAGGAAELLAADLPGLEEGAEVREDGGFRQAGVDGNISEGEAAGGVNDGLSDGGAAGFCDGAHGVR
jgi:hypothetical protein